jgi:DNA topoisomerase-1
MAKSLVIVESPAKARTISKYLGKDFVVKASLGHIKDLPKNELAVDIEHDFKPTYVLIEGKKKVLQEIKQAAKKADRIYLAADPDREGEAICYHLQQELESKRNGGPPIHRVMFHEITANAVRKAFEKPGQVDLRLVEAQQARRILDRLVGYKISPLLWDKVRRGLSAGRVQTVALRLIVEREREIRQFQRGSTGPLTRTSGAQAPGLRRASLKRNEEPSRSRTRLPHARSSGSWRARPSRSAPFTREKRRQPPPPFITSTLQQEAARKLRFSVKRTMMIAQRLYEGVDLGEEGPVGLITYMRTDSPRVSPEALEQVRAFIGEIRPASTCPRRPMSTAARRMPRTPTRRSGPPRSRYTPKLSRRYLQEDELKLYRLIWLRFVACQMTPAVFDQTTIEVTAQGKDGAEYLFRATGSVRKFDGFMAVYEEGKDQPTRRTRNSNTSSRSPRAKSSSCAASRPSSTSPNRLPATPRRPWSSNWKRTASDGLPPTPPSSPPSRSAVTSPSRADGWCPPSWAWRLPTCWWKTSTTSSKCTTPRAWKRSWTKSRKASATGARPCASFTRNSSRTWNAPSAR